MAAALPGTARLRWIRRAAAQIGGYLKTPAKNAADQGSCGVYM
jgi:hypothetical protein